MDNLKVDISFIIPCHNVEKYIKPLLFSFQALNLEGINAEFIFVLDNCTDNTESLIRHYMYPLTYEIITADVRAPGLARNLGLNQANGEFIWFVDSDDWIINPEVLQQALPVFRNRPNDSILQLNFVSNFFKMQHYSMVWQYIFRYDLLKNIRFNEKQNFEDNDFSAEAINMNGKENIPYLNVPSYFYNYCRPDSQTTKLRESNL